MRAITARGYCRNPQSAQRHVARQAAERLERSGLSFIQARHENLRRVTKAGALVAPRA